MAADTLYQKIILEHNKNPRNFGELAGDCFYGERDNPVCGDQVKLMLRVNRNNILETAKFTARGCALCIASASMLTEIITQKPVAEVKQIIAHVFSVFQNTLPANQLERYGDFYALKGVLEYPVRIKCVLLCWHALDDILDSI